jgi:DNA-binding MarR family transcriptional regulator
LVDKLVARELLSRQPSAQDRRQTNITLTTQGEDVLEEAPDALQQRYVRAFADLADWEQAQLVSSLERVAAMLNVDSLDAAPVLATGELRTSKKAY